MAYKNYELAKQLMKERYANDADYREKKKERNRKSFRKHREAYLAKAKIYRDNNRAILKERNRAARNKCRFGMTEEEYCFILESQNGRCAICGKLPNTQRFDIDHDHETLIIRGLLCRGCNRFLGLFENSEIRSKIESYLQIGKHLQLAPLKRITQIKAR